MKTITVTATYRIRISDNENVNPSEVADEVHEKILDKGMATFSISTKEMKDEDDELLLELYHVGCSMPN